MCNTFNCRQRAEGGVCVCGGGGYLCARWSGGGDNGGVRGGGGMSLPGEAQSGSVGAHQGGLGEFCLHNMHSWAPRPRWMGFGVGKAHTGTTGAHQGGLCEWRGPPWRSCL
jgi:hypothetical protein